MSACDKCREAIGRGDLGAASPHMGECDSCSSYAEAFSFMGTDKAVKLQTHDLEGIFQGVQMQLYGPTGSRRVLAQLPTPQRYLAVVLLALVTGMAVFLFVRRPDFGVYPWLRWLLEVFLFGAIVLSYLWLLIRPLHRPKLGKKVIAGQIISTLAVLAIPLMLPLAHQGHQASLEGIGDDLFRRAGVCFAWGTMIGGVLATVAFLFIQGTKGVRFAQGAFWIGAGMFAQFVLHLHCPIVHPLHIALGHTAIVACAAVAVTATAIYLQNNR